MAQEVSITVLSYVSNRVDIVLCSWCPSSSLSPKSLHPSTLASSLQPVTFVWGTFIMWTQGDPLGSHTQGSPWRTYSGVPLAHILRGPLGSHTQGSSWLTYSGVPFAHILRGPLGSHTQGSPWLTYLGGSPWLTYSGIPLAHILRGSPQLTYSGGTLGSHTRGTLGTHV